MPVSERAFLAAAKALCSRCSNCPADRARGPRNGKGLFHLSQNLRLAHHHGVQAGGHAEEVAHGFLIAVLVNMRSQQRRIEAEMADGESRSDRSSGDSTAASSSTRLQVETIMHSVTPGIVGQGARSLGQILAGDGDALAQLNGRGLVIHADERECHWGPNLWTWLKRLAAHTAIITTRDGAGDIGGFAAPQPGAAPDQQQQNIDGPHREGSKTFGSRK